MNNNQPQSYSFQARGHSNILANHVKTLEINKDDFLTERGDCIVGISSDFDLEELKKFHGWVDIFIRSGGYEDRLKCLVNPNFRSDSEFVIRKSKYDSPRTFGFNSSKASNKISRELIDSLRSGNILTIKIVQRIKRVHRNKYASNDTN